MVSDVKSITLEVILLRKIIYCIVILIIVIVHFQLNYQQQY